MPHADTTSVKIYAQIKHQRRGDRALGRECDINVQYVLDLFNKQNGKCALTGVDMTLPDVGRSIFDLSIDRIDNSKGHIKGNVHLVCQGVNFMRNAYTVEEAHQLLAAIKRNYEEPN